MHDNDDMHGMGWWDPKDISPDALSNRQLMMGSSMGMQQQMMDQMMQNLGNTMKGQ